jgi:hypothetical protein
MKFCALLFLMQLSLLPAFAGSEMSPPAGEAGTELTARFSEFSRTPPVLTKERLAAYKLLFVPGFNADYVQKARGYFLDQRAVLHELGLEEGTDFLVVQHQEGFSGEKSVANNAAAIARLIRGSDRPVLIVSHSKGGVDVLEALFADPLARARVKGWISIQGAFFGSVLADTLSQGASSALVDLYLRAFGGGIDSLKDLRQPLRLGYMSTHLNEISALVKQLPILEVSTRKPQAELPINLKLLIPFFGPESAAGQTDGMLEIKNTLLPAAPFVVMEGIDHEELTQGAGGGFDRSRFTRVLLAFFLGLPR